MPNMPIRPKPLAPADVERRNSLIATHSFVGAPRADRLIADGHHPFNPARIVVLENDQANGFVDDGLFPLCGQVREHVGQQLDPVILADPRMTAACVISIGVIELVLPVRDAGPAMGRLSILCPRVAFTIRPGRRSAF